MPPRFTRPKLSGTVTVRRFLPPQLETTANISKGVFSESLEDVAGRIGVLVSGGSDDEPNTLDIVDEQGLAIMGKLINQGIYYVMGGSCVGIGDAQELRQGAVHCGDLSTSQAPDAAVLWAFDPRMLLHQPDLHRSPETPHRLHRAIEALQQCSRAADVLPAELHTPLPPPLNVAAGSWPNETPAGVSEVNRALFLAPRLATMEEVLSFHDPAVYTDFILRGTALPNLKSDVYCNEKVSSVAARLSAAAVVDAGLAVLKSVAAARLVTHSCPADRPEMPLIAYCLVRPPGHHCTCSQPSGFCLVNNVAIAAQQLRQNTTALSRVPRIAIIDLDVHFGEGTAAFVESVADSSSLIYLSLHRYDQRLFYPFDPKGDSAYTGDGGARGCICNAGINTNAHHPLQCEEVISDHLLNTITKEIFLPRLSAFDPDIIFVSLGFDAAYGDPLGKMAVENGFASVIVQLKQWCQSGEHSNRGSVGLVVLLEGGYNPEAVAQGVVSVALALSLSRSDASVKQTITERIPRIWGDLRQRQCRRYREWLQVQSEKTAENEVAPEVPVCSKEAGESGGGSVAPEQVAEDVDLLARHSVWCDKVVTNIRNLHVSSLAL